MLLEFEGEDHGLASWALATLGAPLEPAWLQVGLRLGAGVMILHPHLLRPHRLFALQAMHMPCRTHSLHSTAGTLW